MRRRPWRVRRTGTATTTGQQRWDRAYQLLLQWTAIPPAPAEVPAPLILPEASNARSDLREFIARIGRLACRDGWRRRTPPPMTLDPPCRSKPMLIAVTISPNSGAG